jgi:hypothetical protein
VLAAEHLLDLAGLDFLIELIEPLQEFAVHRLAGFSPFDQHSEIVGSLLERQTELAILLETAAAQQDTLRFGLVLPEIGSGCARLEARQLVFGS